MFKSFTPYTKLWLLFHDLVIVNALFWGVRLLQAEFTDSPIHLKSGIYFFLFSLAYTAVAQTQGMYKERIVRDLKEASFRQLKTLFFVFALLACAMFVFKPWYLVQSRLEILLTFAALAVWGWIVRLPLARWLFRSIPAITQSRVCIVGNGKQSRAVQELFLQQEQPSAILVGTVLMPEEQRVENDNQLFPLLGTFDELNRIVKDKGIQQIIIASDAQEHEALLKLGDKCQQLGLSVHFVSDLLRNASKYALDKEMDIPIFSFPSIERGIVWETGKRIFDFVFSLFVIILTSLPWLVISVAIKLSSAGPVFYRREVVGKHGKTFTFYKFRTMCHKSDDTAHQEYMKELITKGTSPDLSLGKQVYKITKDPRITSAGHLIRKFSLDELPQFLNVLKGDMSIVGPRPCNTEEFQH